MNKQESRGSGRPKVNVLSRELIFKTALELISNRGEAGASIREIARTLGVQPSSLYNHVAGQEDIIGGVRELISDQFDLSGFDSLPWDEALKVWARSYRLAFASHPPTIALLAVKPLVADSRVSQMYDRVCESLIEAGWPSNQVLSLIVALEAFILGAALDRAAPSEIFEHATGDSSPHFRDAFNARNASLTKLAETSPDAASDAAFEFGLEAILTGFRAHFNSIHSMQ